MPVTSKPTGIRTKSLVTVEKLSKRFDVDDNDCWVWNGYCSKGGYGQFSINGKTRNAHRVMFELVGNELLSDKQLDHICRVRACVNPKHLQQVTVTVNMQDSLAPSHLNRIKTHCANGHEFTPENTYVHSYKAKNSVHRKCRKCQVVWDREKNLKNKELEKQREVTE